MVFQYSKRQRIHYDGTFGGTSVFSSCPESKEKETALFQGIDYISLFHDLAQKDFFDTLVFYTKETQKRCLPQICL